MKKNHKNIQLYRVYEPPAAKHGLWLLVDRLWPRGLKKNELSFDDWIKDIAPSPKLRKWFNHDPAKWEEFAKHYIDELKKKPELLESILKQAGNSEISLFYAAKDTQYNHAQVLKAVLASWPKWPEITQAPAPSQQ
ncbi:MULTISPECIES: DUF488 domain-containing protein [Legionella]|uniref:DUF488 family protein n=1 Tax=Legionella septentrionalis TaxID=2498109 RepID=A0A3S0VMJ9_9GAMM|nr:MULTISPECIES: DUF488 family protein [Legionella]MCP0913677.1 DUF488 family protein [Legionella sp. 27cVA30]RUQ84456.1 DUF488 family protein [Legionella septentrionalis]RUQ93701.1 DUF488 family protein [Legionella septentrionalis]RUR09259.1 DUF488 family protein [Legionella septentrionalis]RUR14473.1 DUF488 family protein [Legionella septentrionalis]